MKKKAKENPAKLNWSWQSEAMEDPLKGLGGFLTENRLLDQVRTGLDASDYLWYMTSVENKNNENMTLRVKTEGQVLHAFVNGDLIGSNYSSGEPNFSFVFERAASMKEGNNSISLLSATVGLKHYGHKYELKPAGIVDGPVQLIGSNSTLDLSMNKWSYKVGLDGLQKGLYRESDKSISGANVPTNKPFTWYQTNFEAPLGSEPVVVDLLGTGKGEAWVNGRSLGRYWPSFIASKDGCGKCDYRGDFHSGKCLTGCGEPSQRWYHVPRSFLKVGEPNVLTLFEEAGGDPSEVDFQTVAAEKICGRVPEGKNLTLSCQGHGRTIAGVEFASFGDRPEGSCGSFRKAGCDTENVVSAVGKACLGKESCSLEASENFFGDCHDCDDLVKILGVQATCS